ncbi:MAG: hypothetical protein HZY73_11545 [Micropruina sp.]|nr:MAG: hypothetical protein HZY73_11545 [Micropruina sp.]
MNGIVAGWTRANQRQWDPGVWDAVDAYPNRLTDTRALSNAARLKERGTYEPAGESAPFTVMRLYAYSNHDGTEALVLGGYYTNPRASQPPTATRCVCSPGRPAAPGSSPVSCRGRPSREKPRVTRDRWCRSRP